MTNGAKVQKKTAPITARVINQALIGVMSRDATE
jgi:hypothetical protein